MSRGLRVFVWGQPHPDSFVRNVAVTLAAMGVPVATLRPPRTPTRLLSYAWAAETVLERVVPAVHAQLEERKIREAARFAPTVILSLTRELRPATFYEVRRRTGALMLHWHADAIANISRGELVTNDYDGVFLKNRAVVNRLRAMFGDRFHYLTEAMNPMWHRRVQPDARYACDIGVAGNLYAYRCRVLEQLPNRSIKIWGPRPSRWLRSPVTSCYTGEYIAEGSKAIAFSTATVALNTLSLREEDSINCRAFEIAGCGGFHVMEHRPSISEHFDPGREILLYQSIDELRDFVERGIQDRSFNERLRVAAAARALAHHTYEARLRAMFGCVEIVI